MCDDSPPGQGVPGPRRRLGPVGVDPEPAVVEPAEVTAEEEELVASRVLQAARRPDVTAVGEEQLRRQDPAGDGPPRSVEVGQYRIEQSRALQHARLEHLPVRGRHHQGDSVQLPRRGRGHSPAVGDRLAVAVDRDVGDAVVFHQAVDNLAKALEPVTPAFGDDVGELGPGGPHRTRLVEELVVRGGRAAVGAVSGQQVVQIVVVVGCCQRPCLIRHAHLRATQPDNIRDRSAGPLSCAAQYAPGAGRGCPARRRRWTAGPAFPGCRRPPRAQV